MIEINLLPGQKRKAAGGRKLRIPDVRAVIANVTDPWLLGAIAAAVIAGGGNAVLYAVNSARASRLDSVLKGVRTEQRRFAAVVAQKHSAERVRDSLAAEMAIIRGIDADRYIWPHILDEITKALPAYTWVTNIQALAAPPQAAPGAPTTAAADSTGTELSVSIDGRTVDIEAYTTFLRQLAASPWLREVLPTRATTVIEQDRPVTEFNITARYRAADSLYIRTVPIVQSVR
jgi:type IV pilus assembly protein PilN